MVPPPSSTTTSTVAPPIDGSPGDPGAGSASAVSRQVRSVRAVRPGRSRMLSLVPASGTSAAIVDVESASTSVIASRLATSTSRKVVAPPRRASQRDSRDTPASPPSAAVCRPSLATPSTLPDRGGSWYALRAVGATTMTRSMRILSLLVAFAGAACTGPTVHLVWDRHAVPTATLASTFEGYTHADVDGVQRGDAFTGRPGPSTDPVVSVDVQFESRF